MAISIGLLALLSATAGFAIGAIGIGGILLVSGLIYVGGMAPAAAIAVSMMGYILTGVIGTAVYARRQSIAWPLAGWLSIGALPGALAGAWLSNVAAPAILELAIALLTLAAGIHALANRLSGETGTPRSSQLVAIGVATGCGSALTGTGGPLILVPTLLWLGTPALTAIGLSQVIQIPIGILATIGNSVFGALDPVLGATVAVGLAVGSYAGAHAVHHLPREQLRSLVACVLVLVGVAIAVRVAYRSLA